VTIGDWHTNTIESRFALMKRAVFGTHHSISEAHLHRYLVEWDGERAALALKGAEVSAQRVSLTEAKTIRQKVKRFLRWRKRKCRIDSQK
jgi:ISXO2-like transposase domain